MAERRRLAVLLLAIVPLAACTQSADAIFERGLELERERSGLVASYTEVDGYQLAYVERSGPGETVVLLHGFASEKEAWFRFIRFIPEEYRVLAFDLPGHGESTQRQNATYDVPYLADRLSEGLDQVVDGPFHITGNSLGGVVALLYAHANPQRVISLGLFSAAGVETPEESEFERMLATGDNPLIVESREDFDRLMSLVFVEPPLMPWPVGDVLTRRFITQAEFHRKMWHDIWSRRGEVRGILDEVAAPVFILWGEEDRILHPSSVAVFVRGLPKAEVYMLPATGHSPMIERPSRSAGLYREFLQRHRG